MSYYIYIVHLCGYSLYKLESWEQTIYGIHSLAFFFIVFFIINNFVMLCNFVIICNFVLIGNFFVWCHFVIKQPLSLDATLSSYANLSLYGTLSSYATLSLYATLSSNRRLLSNATLSLIFELFHRSKFVVKCTLLLNNPLLSYSYFNHLQLFLTNKTLSSNELRH